MCISIVVRITTIFSICNLCPELIYFSDHRCIMITSISCWLRFESWSLRRWDDRALRHINFHWGIDCPLIGCHRILLSVTPRLEKYSVSRLFLDWSCVECYINLSLSGTDDPLNFFMSSNCVKGYVSKSLIFGGIRILSMWSVLQNIVK